MKVLVTRPQEDAAITAELLAKKGHSALISPMLAIDLFSDVDLDVSSVQAILLTSRNGARALGASQIDRGMTVLAVGRSTAAEARDAGFSNVADADGNVDDLVALTGSLLAPDGGDLVHIAGSDVAGDLAGQLSRKGFTVRRQVLYRAQKAESLTTEVEQALRHRQIDAVLFFSPRSAETFARLVGEDAELTRACDAVLAFCISQKAADALGGVPFKYRVVAARPNQEDLLAALSVYSEGDTSKMSAPKDPKAETDPVEQTVEADVATVPDSDAKPEEDSSPVEEPVEAVQDEEAQVTEAAPQAAEAPKRSDGLARLLGIVAIVLVLLVYGLSQRPEVPGGSASKLSNLESTVTALASTAGNPQVSEGLTSARNEINALQQQISNLAGAIEDLQAAQHEPPVVPDHSDTLASLDGRIGALENRPEPAATPSVVVAGSGDTEAMATLRSELFVLTEQVANLEGQVSQIASARSDDMARIKADLSATEAQLRTAMRNETAAVSARLTELAALARDAGDSRRGQLAEKAALLLAIGQLRDATATDRPYAGAWKAVTSLGIAASDHGAIADHAADGVASMKDLRDRFSDLGSRAIVADQVGQDESWVGGALKRVGNLVKVRRTGDVEGDSVEAIIARAENRLNQNDPAAALVELDQLQGAAADELAGWRAEMSKRLALDAAVTALQQSVLDGLSGQGD